MTPYQHTDSDGDTLTVYADNGYASVYAHTPGAPSVCVEATKEDAPALALAILEAAGYEYDGLPGKPPGLGAHMYDAIVRLRCHIKAQEATKDAEALDKEADEIRKAWMRGADRPDYGKGWNDIACELKEGWREVARAVRKEKAA